MRRITSVSLAVVVTLAACGCGRGPTSASGVDATVVTLNSSPGDWIVLEMSRKYTVTNARISAIVDRGFGHLQVNIDALDRSEWWVLHATAPQGQPLLPQLYQPVIRWTGASSSMPTLSFSGTGRGCNEVSGHFRILSLDYGALGEIDRLHMTFDQVCDRGPGHLTGELRLVDGGSR